ncbi:hypothetical protein K1719_007612 [Acacia pycnantha]|nr:hypothetical protein K1719_007612 [Acacia pycnantha]
MNSLVIKLLGLSVPKHILIDRVRRMWRPRQPLKVVPLSNEYYIVSFSSMEDRDYALYEGPWMIDDHYLLVQRWRPNFNPQRADCQRRIAVWVRIPDLPMEFCTVEALGMIGNMIGKMIKIDRSTSIYDKGVFARICVEIDLHQPLLPAFTAFGEDKQLVYEGLHLVCFRCGLYGHERANCPDQMEAAIAEQSEQPEMGIGLSENLGIPSQTLVEGEAIQGRSEQSMGGGLEEGSGHPEVRLVNGVENKEGPKQHGGSQVLSGGMKEGSNTVVGLGGGGAPAKESIKAEMKESVLNDRVKVGAKMTESVLKDGVKVSAKLIHGDGGGSKHLGPQMIFRRDMRRSSLISSQRTGMKSGSHDTTQGLKKEGANQGIAKKGNNGLSNPRDQGRKLWCFLIHH